MNILRQTHAIWPMCLRKSQSQRKCYIEIMLYQILYLIIILGLGYRLFWTFEFWRLNGHMAKSVSSVKLVTWSLFLFRRHVLLFPHVNFVPLKVKIPSKLPLWTLHFPPQNLILWFLFSLLISTVSKAVDDSRQLIQLSPSFSYTMWIGGVSDGELVTYKRQSPIFSLTNSPLFTNILIPLTSLSLMLKWPGPWQVILSH